MALLASMGEPPPTETITSAPDFLNSIKASLISAMGEC